MQPITGTSPFGKPGGFGLPGVIIIFMIAGVMPGGIFIGSCATEAAVEIIASAVAKQAKRSARIMSRN
jgi:hypothetical protein